MPTYQPFPSALLQYASQALGEMDAHDAPTQRSQWAATHRSSSLPARIVALARLLMGPVQRRVQVWHFFFHMIITE